QAVDLSDRLVLEDADVLELRTTALDVPTDGTNLALKAAATLREMAGSSRGTRITLEKRIPVAAGLGGGSTDAAAVLVGLNRLWGLRWSGARLAELAVTLGMDVPFFLRGGAALGTGRGEQLESLPSCALALVLVNPRVAASTAEIYDGVVPAMYSDGGRVRGMAAALRSRRPRGVERGRSRRPAGSRGSREGGGPDAPQVRGGVERGAEPPSPDRHTLGRGQAAKARDFGSRIRRFESSRPNHTLGARRRWRTS